MPGFEPGGVGSIPTPAADASREPGAGSREQGAGRNEKWGTRHGERNVSGLCGDVRASARWRSRMTNGSCVPMKQDPEQHGTTRDNTAQHGATQSCGPVARAAPLQGDDRGFESLQDYFRNTMPRYANWQSDPIQSRMIAGSNPALGTEERNTVQ